MWGSIVIALALASGRALAQDCPAPTGDSAFGDQPPCYEPRSDWPTIRAGVEGRAGWFDGEVSNDGVGGGVALFADVSLASFFDLGVSASYLAIGDARDDANADGFDDVDEDDLARLVLVGGPRLVWFTEPMRREAFRLSVSGGYGFGLDSRSASGPILEVAIERQAGMLSAGYEPPIQRYGTGQNFSLGIRYQQGFGDLADYRALFGSVSFAVEANVPLPEDRVRRRRRPPVEYVLRGGAVVGFVAGGDRLSLAYGGSLDLGFPIGDLIIPFVRGGAAAVTSAANGDRAAFFWALAGLRFFRFKIFFADVGVGHDLVVGTESRSAEFPSIASSPFFELGGGGQIVDLECGIGIYAGPRIHVGWGENAAVAFTFETGIGYDNLPRAAECTP
jgi:hypothetical protein